MSLPDLFLLSGLRAELRTGPLLQLVAEAARSPEDSAGGGQPTDHICSELGGGGACWV